MFYRKGKGLLFSIKFNACGTSCRGSMLREEHDSSPGHFWDIDVLSKRYAGLHCRSLCILLHRFTRGHIGLKLRT